MISPRHPSAAAIERYRLERLDVPSTAEPSDTPPDGFHHDAWSAPLGAGAEDFARARDGIRTWIAQRHSGVEVHPADAPMEPATVVALVTRQAGAWLLFACRVHVVTDEPHEFGFTYATLPGHPEQGYETFTVRHDQASDEVTFEIDVVWRPAILLSRLAGPVASATLAVCSTWITSSPSARPPSPRANRGSRSATCSIERSPTPPTWPPRSARATVASPSCTMRRTSPS